MGTGHRRRSRRNAIDVKQVWQFIGLGAVAVAVVALVAFALRPVETPPAQAEPMSTPSSTPEKPVALFIGDSYSHGTGASSKSVRWTTLVSDAMGWVEVNHALGGTGYLVTSNVNGCGKDYCGNYREVLEGLHLQESPDFVIISGGQNDFRSWYDRDVSSAIADTYATARDLFPDAHIVAVGPSNIGDVNEAVSGIDQQVQVAAEKTHATYVSLIDPDALDPSMESAEYPGHVDDRGHRAIADAVLAALR